jgi:hypothetical protein
MIFVASHSERGTMDRRRICFPGLLLVLLLMQYLGQALAAQALEAGAIVLFSERGGIDGREKTLTVCKNGNVRFSDSRASNIESKIDRSQLENLVRLCEGNFVSLQDRYGANGAVSDGITVSVTCLIRTKAKSVELLTGGTPPRAFIDLTSALNPIIDSIRTTPKTGFLTITEASFLEPWPFGATVKLAGNNPKVPVSEDLFRKLMAKADHDRWDLHRDVFYLEKGLIYRVDYRKGDRKNEYFFDTRRIMTVPWPVDFGLPVARDTDTIPLDKTVYPQAKRFLASFYEQSDSYDKYIIDGKPESGNRLFRIRIVDGTKPTKDLCSQPDAP